MASPAALSSAVPKIGVVGHSRAGKTVFVASLERALSEMGWTVTIGVDERRYLDGLMGRLKAGYFPDKTQVASTYDKIEIHADKQTCRPFEMSLFDPAGELFETDPHDLEQAESDRRAAGRAALMDYLAECTGFIILLDLEHKGETFTQTVSNFLQAVKTRLLRAGHAPSPASVNAHGRKLNRAAVLFSKADLLPWQHRYRIRSAADWVADPKNGLTDMTSLVRTHFEQCRFEFTSTIGWSQGLSNVRTAVLPRPFSAGVLARIAGDHLPDPALYKAEYDRGVEDPSQFRFMKSLPVFHDPLRIMRYDSKTAQAARDEDLAGVPLFPGRRASKDVHTIYSPWNVVEPLLWVAGNEV